MKQLTIIFLKIWKIFRNKDLKDIFVFLVFIIGVFLVFNYTRTALPQKLIQGGIYREGLYEPVNSLNPLSPQNDSETAILNIIYPPLIEFDNGEIFSRYIKNYYFSPDYLTLTIELKDNLFWSNGTKISADDLKFSFDILKKSNQSNKAIFFENVELEIIDPHKVKFVLNFNNNYFLYRLNHLNILPEKIFSSSIFEEKFNLDNLKIGSGPFVFESLSKKGNITVITLSKNKYHNPKPYFDKIIFYVYPSPKRALEALILKEIDGVAGLNYLKSPSNLGFHYKIYKITLPRVIGIFFNSQKIKKEQVDFLNQKVNRYDLIKNVFNNLAEESFGIFSPTVRKILNIPDINLNFQKISTSSLPNILVPYSYFYPEIARYLKEKKLIDFSFIDSKDIPQIIKEKNFEGILYGLEYSHPPEFFSFFSNIGYNINNLTNINLEKNFQKIISDPEIKMNEELAKIEKEIIDLNQNVFLLNPYYLYFMNKKIKGFDQFYLVNPTSRFVKIHLWHKTK